MDFFAEGYTELFGIQTSQKYHIFATEFGFDENQTVALLGAHTLGQVGKKQMNVNLGLLAWSGR